MVPDGPQPPPLDGRKQSMWRLSRRPWVLGGWLCAYDMGRTIYKPVPNSLQRRLDSPGCQEYLRRESELIYLAYEAGSRNNFDFAEYEALSEKLEVFFESLTGGDKTALEEKSAIDSSNDDAMSYLMREARRLGITDTVDSTQREQEYIAHLEQTLYVYPSFSDLVGPPADIDFLEVDPRYPDKRWLTSERIADLLLVGAFLWNGMYIARTERRNTGAPDGWLVCLDPDFEPTYALGAMSTGSYVDNTEFLPFKGVKTGWLHDHLYDCGVELGYHPARQPNEKVTFRDGNPFNCRPDNLVLAKKPSVGRPMRCKACGEITTREDSAVVREGWDKVRYCLTCLRHMTSGG